MKSLDEVIDIFEKACDLDRRCEDFSGCLSHYDEGCPNDGSEAVPDALHYLKDMKNLEEDYDILYNKYWREFNQQQANPQLTWDELRQMEGKPVWVEDNIDEPEDITKYWAIYRRIEKAQETEYALLSDFYYDKAEYGKSWQAYRRERG